MHLVILIGTAIPDNEEPVVGVRGFSVPADARGVQVLFLRAPSAGEYIVYERRLYPRVETWDVLLRASAT